MIRGVESIVLFTEDADKLAAFYRDVIGLKVGFEAKMGEEGESTYLFELGEGSGFGIMTHSKVKGKNMNPDRMMLNLEVDNIEQEAERLEEADVKKIQDIYHVEGYGLIATFEDPDGNYFQLVQVRAEEEQEEVKASLPN